MIKNQFDTVERLGINLTQKSKIKDQNLKYIYIYIFFF
jgi:hypothetical protein